MAKYGKTHPLVKAAVTRILKDAEATAETIRIDYTDHKVNRTIKVAKIKHAGADKWEVQIKSEGKPRGYWLSDRPTIREALEWAVQEAGYLKSKWKKKLLIFTVKELRSNSGRDKLCSLYEVVDGELVSRGKRKASFEDDGQMAVTLALEEGVISGDLVQSPSCSYNSLGVSTATVSWDNAGIAKFRQV